MVSIQLCLVLLAVAIQAQDEDPAVPDPAADRMGSGDRSEYGSEVGSAMGMGSKGGSANSGSAKSGSAKSGSAKSGSAKSGGGFVKSGELAADTSIVLQGESGEACNYPLFDLPTSTPNTPKGIPGSLNITVATVIAGQVKHIRTTVEQPCNLPWNTPKGGSVGC